MNCLQGKKQASLVSMYYLEQIHHQADPWYVLSGTDPSSGRPMVYIGEAEVIRERLRQHRDKEFWVHIVIFVSKDENLTKAHIRYIEGRLIEDASAISRVTILNAHTSSAKLPESDRADMEVFLNKIRQLLPVLGLDLLTPIFQPADTGIIDEDLYCEIKGLTARGRRTPNGFVVFEGSQAVLENRPSSGRHPYIVTLREKLIADGTITQEDNHYRFNQLTEFSSPSAAAAMIHGGAANGLLAWKNKAGSALKELEVFPGASRMRRWASGARLPSSSDSYRPGEAGLAVDRQLAADRGFEQYPLPGQHLRGAGVEEAVDF